MGLDVNKRIAAASATAALLALKITRDFALLAKRSQFDEEDREHLLDVLRKRVEGDGAKRLISLLSFDEDGGSEAGETLMESASALIFGLESRQETDALIDAFVESARDVILALERVSERLAA